MKIAGLFGKIRGGEWVTLATPAVPLTEQKAFIKQLKAENGRSVLVDGKRVDLEEAILFVSGSGKWVGFKKAGKTPVASADLVPNLDKLAEALGISRDELDEMRKADGFPLKEKDGYNVASVREWMKADAIKEA